MQRLPSLCHGALALVLACGPKSADPGDTDTDPTTTGDVPGTTGPTTGDAPGTTDRPDPTATTGDPTTGDPTTGDPTTGDPFTCPEGQAQWSRLSSAQIDLPPLASVSRLLAPMADGRFAFAAGVADGDSVATGLVTFSRTGDVHVLAGQPGPPDQPLMVLGVHRAPDDSLIVFRLRGPNGSQVPGLAHFAADGTPIGEVDLAPEWRLSHVAPVDQDVVLVAADRMARFAVDTGEVVWMTTIDGVEGDAIVQGVDIGPEGDVLLSASSSFAGDGPTRLHAWRFDAGGAPVWSREIDVPAFDTAHAIQFGPQGQVFVLRFGPWPEGQADLVALDFATGEDLWSVTAAQADEQQRFVFISEILVDADAVSLVVARSVPEKLALESVGVQRVSFAGELQEFVPLDVPPTTESAVQALRGDCGELVVLTGFGAYWLGTFAP